jgi:murein L,D-transpeptidase YcbB/YkuD
VLNVTIVRSLAVMSIVALVLAVARSPTVGAAETPQVTSQDPISIQIRSRISGASPRGDVNLGDWNALVSFYSELHGTPVWVSTSGLTARGKQAIAELRRADDWGLVARAFDLPQIKASGASPQVLAEAEIKIGLSVLKYARQARGGRMNPSQLSRDLDQSPNVRDPKRILREIANSDGADAYLRSLHPKHPQFKLLQLALLRARGRQGEREGIVSAGRAIKSPRSSDRQYEGREDREGDDGTGSQTDDTSPDLDTFPEEGAPRSTGPRYVESIDDIRRILINMERWRWMPDDLGEFYVWDNIPEFITRVVKKGKVVYDDKIIVGKQSTPTPIFSAPMQFIVFHPEWAVPDSIKVNEILPHLRYEPGFFGIGAGMDTSILRQQNLRVVFNGSPVDPARVDWAHVDIRQFQFLQAPGERNVLGTLKFRFPNRHDVYMHDTPERTLFARSMRALSHGCMRVQNPRRLAEILLGEDKGWSTSEIGNLLATGYNTEIELTRKFPVHVTYFTAIAGEDGRVQFFGDVYGHDNLIASALDGKPLRSSVAFDAEPERPAARRPTTSRPAGGLDDLFSILLGF